MLYSFLMKLLVMSVTFSCNEMGNLRVNLNNINLDNNFDEDDPDTTVPIKA